MLKGPHFFERGRNSKMMRTHGFCVAEPLEFKIKLVQADYHNIFILSSKDYIAQVYILLKKLHAYQMIDVTHRQYRKVLRC